MSVDAIAELPTARIVRRFVDVLNDREVLRHKCQSPPSPQCLQALNEINYFTICSHIVQSFNNVSNITPSQAEEFCDYHCSQVLIGAYNKVLTACSPDYAPNRQVTRAAINANRACCDLFLYSNLRASKKYCTSRAIQVMVNTVSVKEWVDPALLLVRYPASRIGIIYR